MNIFEPFIAALALFAAAVVFAICALFFAVVAVIAVAWGLISVPFILFATVLLWIGLFAKKLGQRTHKSESSLKHELDCDEAHLHDGLDSKCHSESCWCRSDMEEIGFSRPLVFDEDVTLKP